MAECSPQYYGQAAANFCCVASVQMLSPADTGRSAHFLSPAELVLYASLAARKLARFCPNHASCVFTAPPIGSARL